MNTPTPVDLIIKQFRDGEAHSDGLILTLRDLELKLTAALAEIDRLDVAGIHSCHANCQKPICVMRRELTAVTEQRDRLRRWTSVNGVIDLQCQRDEARGQRDRLAEALEQLMAYQPRSTVITTNERHVWSNAKDALQSLNQPTEP